MVPADVAAWIRDVVLPAAYRRNSGDPARCDCQHGICLACQKGQHADCMVVAWGGAPHAHPETYICDARGYVASARGITNEVWRAGRPCRWICPCGCTPIGPARPPAGIPSTYQLDLFALLNPNRSTT